MLRVSSCLLFFVTILFFASCQGPRRTVYFVDNTAPDTLSMEQAIAPHLDATIQPDDILAINIASTSFLPDDKPNQVFLEGGIANLEGGVVSVKNSYLVDSSGYIDYPRIGRIKMAGLTIPQAKLFMIAQLKDYLKQPVVEMRIVNYRITMLGEVGAPGIIMAPNHKMTIIDALAKSGGISTAGRKDNVMIIREIKGVREFGHINLNSKNVFNSPYYYLRQNDIVYVEPSNIRKQEGNEFLKFYLPTITSLLSTALTVYALIQISNSK